jgi:putative inorganic carbon (HCO3(-)) transporter
VSTALEVIGGIAGTAAASAALLSGDRRLRAVGMLAALALAAVLVLGQAWDDQLTHVRDRPLELAAIVIALAGGLALLAAAFIRWPLLLPLLLIAVLPFRIPIDTGSETSYLLIPLYLVIGGGVLAEAAALFRGDAREIGAPSGFARWLAIALAASIVLYAVQSAYSSDVSRAAQNIAFFLIPFTVMFGLLREVEWDSRMLRYALLVVVGESLILAAIGIVQHEAHHIFWNAKAMESNEFDLNFRVNSLFWDPNIYARYLGLALVLLVGALLWVKDMRRFAVGAFAVALIFTGMAFAFSQTGYFALLAGIVVLCALRWSLRWTAVVTGAAVLAAAAVVVIDRGAFEVNSGSGGESSGRGSLVSGGLDLARDRPLQGFGAGSFATEFAKRHQVEGQEAVVSHTEPVTVAAEQGAVGVLVYLGVLLTSIGVLIGAGLRDIAPGLGGHINRHPQAAAGSGREWLGNPDRSIVAARIAIAAAFGGLLVHTIGYAGFLTDPLTWALLAVGSALATLRT